MVSGVPVNRPGPAPFSRCDTGLVGSAQSDEFPMETIEISPYPAF
jgi:hypothetical protein